MIAAVDSPRRTARRGPAARAAPIREPVSAGAPRVRARREERLPVKAIWNGATIAESDDTVVVEGNHYFPESSLKREYVTFSNHRSSCPWKGQAHYYSLLVDGALNENAVWYYPEPSEAAREIKGRVAFWKGVTVTE
jgi:uncharacterized protein (DUF427 family)